MFVRSTANGHGFRISTRSALEASEAERREIYEAAWAKGGLQFRASFGDLVTDRRANGPAKVPTKGAIMATASVVALTPCPARSALTPKVAASSRRMPWVA